MSQRLFIITSPMGWQSHDNLFRGNRNAAVLGFPPVYGTWENVDFNGYWCLVCFVICWGCVWTLLLLMPVGTMKARGNSSSLELPGPSIRAWQRIFAEVASTIRRASHCSAESRSCNTHCLVLSNSKLFFLVYLFYDFHNLFIFFLLYL